MTSHCPICGKEIPREFCFGCGLIPARLDEPWRLTGTPSEPRHHLVGERL